MSKKSGFKLLSIGSFAVISIAPIVVSSCSKEEATVPDINVGFKNIIDLNDSANSSLYGNVSNEYNNDWNTKIFEGIGNNLTFSYSDSISSTSENNRFLIWNLLWNSIDLSSFNPMYKDTVEKNSVFQIIHQSVGINGSVCWAIKWTLNNLTDSKGNNIVPTIKNNFVQNQIIQFTGFKQYTSNDLVWNNYSVSTWTTSDTVVKINCQDLNVQFPENFYDLEPNLQISFLENLVKSNWLFFFNIHNGVVSSSVESKNSLQEFLSSIKISGLPIYSNNEIDISNLVYIGFSTYDKGMALVEAVPVSSTFQLINTGISFNDDFWTIERILGISLCIGGGTILLIFMIILLIKKAKVKDDEEDEGLQFTTVEYSNDSNKNSSGEMLLINNNQDNMKLTDNQNQSSNNQMLLNSNQLQQEAEKEELSNINEAQNNEEYYEEEQDNDLPDDENFDVKYDNDDNEEEEEQSFSIVK